MASVRLDGAPAVIPLTQIIHISAWISARVYSLGDGPEMITHVFEERSPE